MKKLLIYVFASSMLLVGCSANKNENKEEEKKEEKVVNEYKLQTTELKLDYKEIYTISLAKLGNKYTPKRFIDHQLYFDLMTVSCAVCDDPGTYVDYYQYNLSNQSFSVAQRSDKNQPGVPFNNGIVRMSDSPRQMYPPVSYVLNYYNKDGVKEIFSLLNTYSIVDYFVSKDYIYVSIQQFDDVQSPLLSHKVMKYDKDGNLVSKEELPLHQDEFHSLNLYAWYVLNDELKTVELPEKCMSSTLNPKQDDDLVSVLLVECFGDMGKQYYQAIDNKSGELVDLIPNLLDVATLRYAYRIDPSHLLVASITSNDDPEASKETDTLNGTSFGIYDLTSRRYIPIIDDEAKTLTQFMIVPNSPATNANELYSPLVYNEKHKLARFTINGDVLSIQISSISESGYMPFGILYEDSHLFINYFDGPGEYGVTPVSHLIYAELK